MRLNEDNILHINTLIIVYAIYLTSLALAEIIDTRRWNYYERKFPWEYANKH